jgi:altronate dehydratase
LTEVTSFGERARAKDLFFVNTLKNDLISLTGPEAAGCKDNPLCFKLPL